MGVATSTRFLVSRSERKSWKRRKDHQNKRERVKVEKKRITTG